VTGLLNKMGIEVRTALNGAVALQMVEEEAFELILMDYQMPVMNGLDATIAMRARGVDIPIIGLTANAFVDDRAACMAAGMNDFIAKPVTRDKLTQSLQRFCRFETEVVEHAPTIEEDGVDRGQFRALIEDLGSDVVADLLFSYRGDALKLLEEISEASEARRAEALDRALHAFKGVSQTVGLSRLAARVQAMRDGSFPDRVALLGLRQACDEGLAILTRMLAEPPAPQRAVMGGSAGSGR
jgi:CheY-like chemotaxis protein